MFGGCIISYIKIIIFVSIIFISIYIFVLFPDMPHDVTSANLDHCVRKLTFSDFGMYCSIVITIRGTFEKCSVCVIYIDFPFVSALPSLNPSLLPLFPSHFFSISHLFPPIFLHFLFVSVSFTHSQLSRPCWKS